MDTKRRARVIQRHLKQGDVEKIRLLINRLHPSDSALIVSHLEGPEISALFRVIEARESANIFEHLRREYQDELIKLFDINTLSSIVELMRSDKIADLLGRIEPETALQLKGLMKSDEAEEAYQLLAYPKDTAGGIMSKDYISVYEQETISGVIKFLKSIFSMIDSKKANYVYVVDSRKNLVGVVQMRDLVINEGSKKIADIMIKNLITVQVDMDQEAVVNVFKKYDLMALPVIDNNGRMLGIITSESIIDVIDEEVSEDMLKISGISGGDESYSTPLKSVVKKRLGWLSLNIVLDVVAASVIIFYEDTLTAVIALAVFLPIISDMSGNSGMQSIVVNIRELALGRITKSDYRRIIMRELVIGLVSGLVLGIQIGLIAYIWQRKAFLGLVVSLALWINTVISVLLGSMLPAFLKRFKIDPAIASGPVLTTVTDMSGFFLVLFIAERFIKYLV